MRYKLLAATAVALVVLAALLATSAQAKGPFVVEVSGGGLGQPVALPGTISEDKFFSKSTTSAPSQKPLDVAYKLDLYQPGTSGAKGDFLFTAVYYPAQAGQPARMLNDGIYTSVNPDLERLLDTSIAVAHSPSSLPSAGGPPDSDSPSLLWYIAPSLALALAVVGRGLAGRRLLMRRMRD